MNTARSSQQPLFLYSGFVLLAAIVYLSLSTNILAIPGDAGGHYAHVGAYALLMFWFARLCRSARSVLLVGAALMTVGVLIEFAQGYSGYRHFEVEDMVADAVGIALGWFAARSLTTRLSGARQAS